MTETYDDPPRLVNLKCLAVNETPDIVLDMLMSDGSKAITTLDPAQASELVSKLIYTGRDQFLRHGKAMQKSAPQEAIPIPIDHLGAEEGPNPGEATLWLTVGPLRLAMAADLLSLTGLCQWVSSLVGSNAPPEGTPRQ